MKPTDMANPPEESNPNKVARDAEAFVELRWEKEVERDLMLLIQAWRAESCIEAIKTKKSATTLLRLQTRLFREPVYFPLGGNVESALGDALAEAEGVLLIECKRKIDADEWMREAMEPEPYTKESGEQGTRNQGGKGRKKQLSQAAATLDDGLVERIANECHMIVASSGYRISFEHGIQDGLRYTLYWPFVMAENEDSAVIDLHPVNELRTKGAEFVDFYRYVNALAKGRGAAGGAGTADQEDRYTVLARRHGIWYAWRLVQSTLIAGLKAAAKSNKLSEEKKRTLDEVAKLAAPKAGATMPKQKSTRKPGK